jgi:hypothetical protein
LGETDGRYSEEEKSHESTFCPTGELKWALHIELHPHFPSQGSIRTLEVLRRLDFSHLTFATQ